MTEYRKRSDAAEASERDGKWAEAAAVWAELGQGRSDPRLSYRYGRALRESGRLQEAEEVYRVAIRDHPEDARGYFGLGLVLKRLDRPEEARSAIRGGLTRKESQPVLTILGAVERQLGLREEAEQTLRRSLALNPRDDEAMFHLGVLLQDVSRLDAIALFREALEIDPLLLGGRRELGRTLWGAGLSEEAEETLRAAVAEDPTDAWAHNYLGSLLTPRGLWQEAWLEFQQAIAADATVPLFWANLAEASAGLGLTEEAEQHFKRALILNERSPVANRRYGMFLRAQGRVTEAKRHLALAVEVNPGDERAQRALENLDSESS